MEKIKDKNLENEADVDDFFIKQVTEAEKEGYIGVEKSESLIRKGILNDDN